MFHQQLAQDLGNQVVQFLRDVSIVVEVHLMQAVVEVLEVEVVFIIQPKLLMVIELTYCQNFKMELKSIVLYLMFIKHMALKLLVIMIMESPS
jgi:hypothetical protein